MIGNGLSNKKKAMKTLDRILLTGIIFTIIFFAGTLVLMSQENSRTIQVSGSAEYNLAPDEIVISISFQEYYLDEEDTKSEKIRLEELQVKLEKAISNAAVKSTEISTGSVQIIRPNRHNGYKRSRLNKTIYVCIKNTDQYITLTRELEKLNLFDQTITAFNISEYRHTEKEKYLTDSRSKAYDLALEKASLILSKSGEKLGKVITISELKANSANRNGGFYEVVNTGSFQSGFKPIVVFYEIEVEFEIL